MLFHKRHQPCPKARKFYLEGYKIDPQRVRADSQYMWNFAEHLEDSPEDNRLAISLLQDYCLLNPGYLSLESFYKRAVKIPSCDESVLEFIGHYV